MHPQDLAPKTPPPPAGTPRSRFPPDGRQGPHSTPRSAPGPPGFPRRESFASSLDSHPPRSARATRRRAGNGLTPTPPELANQGRAATLAGGLRGRFVQRPVNRQTAHTQRGGDRRVSRGAQPLRRWLHRQLTRGRPRFARGLRRHRPRVDRSLGSRGFPQRTLPAVQAREGACPLGQRPPVRAQRGVGAVAPPQEVSCRLQCPSATRPGRPSLSQAELGRIHAELEAQARSAVRPGRPDRGRPERPEHRRRQRRSRRQCPPVPAGTAGVAERQRRPAAATGSAGLARIEAGPTAPASPAAPRSTRRGYRLSPGPRCVCPAGSGPTGCVRPPRPAPATGPDEGKGAARAR